MIERLENLLLSKFLRDSHRGKSKLFAVQVRIVAWVTLEPNFVVAATKTRCKWLLRDHPTLYIISSLVGSAYSRHISLYKIFEQVRRRLKTWKLTNQPLGDNGYMMYCKNTVLKKKHMYIFTKIEIMKYMYIHIQFAHT